MNKPTLKETLHPFVEEFLGEQELNRIQEKLDNGERVTAYLGIEPSGKPHLGYLILINVLQKLQQHGIHTIILLADWHAKINGKHNGDMQKIHESAEHLKTIFNKKLNPALTQFKYVTDYANDPAYWMLVMDVANNMSLARTKRAMGVTGRHKIEDNIETAKLIYPAMQIADAYYLNIDIMLGGMDQRHAHVPAHELAHRFNKPKPLAIHTPLLASLQADGRMNPDEAKMSKSQPKTCIYLDDTKQEIQSKIQNAVAEAGNTETPLMQVCKHFVMPAGKLLIERPDKYGGDITYDTYEQLATDYQNKQLHPGDLKNAIKRELPNILGAN